MDRRTIWNGNEHIRLVQLNVGDFVGFGDASSLSCPLIEGQPQWHVLMTAPQQEVRAVEDLNRLGFRTRHFKVYRRQPTGRKDADGRKQMVEVQRAMFPGYVFCDLRQGIHDFGAAEKAKGVRGSLKMVDGAYCIVPAKEWREMAVAEADEEMRYLKSIAPKGARRDDLVIGEVVRVTDGPMAGFSASVSKLDDKGRVEVLLSMFARQSRVLVDGSILEKI